MALHAGFERPRARHRLSCITVWVFLAVWAPSPANGQSFGAAPVLPPHLALDHWDDLNGLPQNTVHALAQTADGYLWVGTQEGLARFDGVRFVTVPLSGSSPVLVRSLLAHPDTSLWIGTSQGLLRLKQGRVASYGGTALEGTHITALFLDSRAQVWVGSGEGALAVIRPSTGEAVTVRQPVGGSVDGFAETADGRIYVASDGGLGFIDPDAEPLELAALPVPEGTTVMTVATGAAGELWVGSSDGLYRRTPNGGFSLLAMEGQPVFRVLPGSSVTGWLVTGSRLLRVDSSGNVVPVPKRLTPADLVFAILRDREGSVWLGTAGSGLARLRETVVASVGADEGLASDVVLPVLEGRDGAIWLGTAGGGINRLSGSDVDTFSVQSGHLPSNYIFSLAEAADGAIWAGTALGAVLIRDGVGRTLTAADGIASRQVRTVLADGANRVWFGGRGGLDVRDRDGAVRHYTVADGLPDDFVLALEEASDGAIWAGTRTGIARIAAGDISAWDSARGYTAGTPLDLHFDRTGRLWLATRDGVARKDGGRFRLYRRADGLCTDHTHAVVDDEAGRLWFSSNRGLFWLWPHDFAAYDRGETASLPCRLIGRAAGMRSREANGGVSPAAIRSAAGLLWFPTVRGAAVVDPERSSLGLAPPPVVIEELRIDGDPVAVDDAVVPPGTRHVTIRFTGLSLVAPSEIRFRYMLEGFDAGWIAASSDRAASYTNLPPGNYRFVVEAANADGEWAAASATLPLKVRPRMWETLWFRAAAIIVLLLGSLAVHRWRVRHVATREREVHALVQARARAETLAVEARLRALRLELHPHFFFNTLNGISGLIRDGDQASALDVLGRFAELTRATLLSRHQQTRPLRDELEYICQYLDLERIRFGDRLTIVVRAEPAAREVPVPPLILQPIVENALRHGVARVARDARLEVAATVTDGSLTLLVRDNGPGVATGLDELPRGTGLSNVRERLSEMYGGRASLDLCPNGRGTTIALRIPLEGAQLPGKQEVS